ncbi:hypothetical protein PR048_009768 [Dryococelus australis]|uniref:Uncharacterized protein n=1 Tax=Dryococelus australis TaxID=614101 RepID=A0ABQ9I1V7_9NEOP|nr:hypothetical protein PR048_009768 [Dryococelus australis]
MFEGIFLTGLDIATAAESNFLVIVAYKSPCRFDIVRYRNLKMHCEGISTVHHHFAGEYGGALGMKGRGKREIPEKTRQPTHHPVRFSHAKIWSGEVGPESCVPPCVFLLPSWFSDRLLGGASIGRHIGSFIYCPPEHHALVDNENSSTDWCAHDAMLVSLHLTEQQAVSRQALASDRRTLACIRNRINARNSRRHQENSHCEDKHREELQRQRFMQLTYFDRELIIGLINAGAPHTEDRLRTDGFKSSRGGSKDRAPGAVGSHGDPVNGTSRCRKFPRTIYRCLAEADLRYRRPIYVLSLTPQQKLFHSQWCQASAMWNTTRCVVMGTDDHRFRVWRAPGKRHNPNLVLKLRTSYAAGIMIWEAVAYRYKDETLQPHLLPFPVGTPGTISLIMGLLVLHPRACVGVVETPAASVALYPGFGTHRPIFLGLSASVNHPASARRHAIAYCRMYYSAKGRKSLLELTGLHTIDPCVIALLLCFVIVSICIPTSVEFQGSRVVRWLKHWPPTKANCGRFLAGLHPVFTRGNYAGQCRRLAGFLGHLPFPPLFHSSAAPYSPHFILIGSQNLVVTSRPNLPTFLSTAVHDKKLGCDEFPTCVLGKAEAQEYLLASLSGVTHWIEIFRVGPQQWLSESNDSKGVAVAQWIEIFQMGPQWLGG